MISKIDKNAVRKARHYRTRRYIAGTPERPRLNVYRSLKHIYAQVINDEAGQTICSASTLDAELRAGMVGELVAERAKAKGVTKVVFDRGGYLYTGRVAEVAGGARKAGLDF